jgi:UDP-N-acetylglucosamine 2-epimerase (non-hydrolysing)
MKKIIALVAGTRPEVIKIAPIYLAMQSGGRFEPYMISTGQHRQMLDQAFGVFGITPDVDLGLMTPNQTLPDLMGRVIPAVAGVLRERRPAAILVQGDTATVLGAAMAAFYERVSVGHVEAGLRTHDMNSPFPEEMNRRLTTPLARWNFCPTELSRDNLLREGIADSLCHVTGNSVIDALFWMQAKLHQKRESVEAVAARLDIPPAFTERYLARPGARWVLVTGHRRESFGGGFERICEAINRLTRETSDVGVLYPVHLNPRVQEPVNRILGGNARVALVPPAAYEDFIWLMDRCHFALSDSGGVQEEAPSLGKPVLVMRETTERPEGLDAGTCTLVGTNPDRIVSEACHLLDSPGEYRRRSELRNPYGDGQTSSRILKVLENSL